MKLYDYYRSSAAYRVRIALNLKQAYYQSVPISLLDDAHNAAAYSAINPHRLVPGLDAGFALEYGHAPDERTPGQDKRQEQEHVNNDEQPDHHAQGVLGQSLAIIEYLDERFPEPPLLPRDLWQKARCREMALTVACDIHPLNNLRVLNYLNTEFGVQQNEKMVWYHHWLERGFQTLETLISRQATALASSTRNAQETPRFCCGDTPMLADLCLIPQLYNAKRFGFDLQAFPHLLAIEQHCLALPAFIAAHPDNVGDH
ncbi:maleylacetoacetate isomerase [Photobacterium japonica]|uniref:maleylacetoacetate isomerase n=1 Tax=Photobacterium japonica TaxID=2910235 RepID=UPI003D0A3F3C